MEPTSIFTDGSCDSLTGTGAWAAIVLSDKEKRVLSGAVLQTTHQRMELTAAIEAINYLKSFPSNRGAVIYTDSQYLADLPGRRKKLTQSEFVTRAKRPVANADLVARLFGLLDTLAVKFVKVRAHGKASGGINYNREADKYVRKIVRQSVKNSGHLD